MSLIEPEAAIKFLEERSRYFDLNAAEAKEDAAVQAFSNNSRVCIRIIELIKTKVVA